MRIQQDLSQLQPKIDHQVALESRLTDLQTKLQQFQSLRFQLDQKQKERDQIQNRFTQVNERIQHRVDLQSKVEQISDLEQQLERLGSQLSRVAAARQFQEEIQTTVALGQDQLSNHTQQVQQILRSLDRLQKDFPAIKTQLASIPPILTQGTALTHQILQQLDQILVDISDQVSPAQLQAQQREIRQHLQDLYQAKVKVDQLPELQIERQDLETKRHDLEGEIEDLEWNLEAEGTFTRQQADLQDQLAHLGDPRAQAKIWEQELSQLPQLEVNWQHFQDQLSHQHQQLQALDQDLHQLAYVDTEIPAMQQQRQQYRSAHQRYLQAEPLAQTLQQRQTDLAQAQHHLQTEIQQGSQLQAQIQAMQSRFGTLTELAQAHAQLSQDLQDLQDPRGQAQRLQEDLKQRPQLLQDLQDLHTQLQGSQQRIQDLDQELAKTTGLEGALSAQQAIREQHRSAYENYLNSLPIAQTLPECETTLQKAQQEVDQVLNHLTQLQDQHKQLGETYDPQQHEQLKTTQRQTELEQARLQTRIQAIQPQLERIQTRIDHLKDLQEQQKQQGISLKERERLHRFIKFSREVLKRAGPRITELYLQNVNVVADRLFREILNRPNVSLNWEPDYDITIQESGCPKRRFISLSGGEQMSAALAVRLALLKVLGELDIAFFDEPTTNMDHQRRQRLAEAITNIRSFKQLFVISHDDTFEQVTENIIRVERSDLTPIREADNGA